MNSKLDAKKAGNLEALEDRVYPIKTFNLSGLQSISDRTLEMHFKLYEGYVKQTNQLNERRRSTPETVASKRRLRYLFGAHSPPGV